MKHRRTAEPYAAINHVTRQVHFPARAPPCNAVISFCRKRFETSHADAITMIKAVHWLERVAEKDTV